MVEDLPPGLGAAADLAPRPLPLLTPGLPGTGGVVRLSEEDFRVEELPLYPASGQGEHLYLTVEKVGRNTQDVARELARVFSVRERDVGSAGLKDKRAVTVQRFSLPAPRGELPAPTAGAGSRAGAGEPGAGEPGVGEPGAGEPGAGETSWSGPGWRVLALERHGNKLRTGHLRGNRFRVVIRGCGAGALERAEAVCAVLRARGAMNLFGPQRFGRRQDNALLGASILRRESTVRDRFLRRLALSALQSELFNRNLAARLRDGLFEEALEGDVLRKRESGGLFVCADPTADSPRVRAGEVDPAGPLPGHSLYAAQGAALAREESVVAEAGLDPRIFAVGGDEMSGARRPYRIPVEELAVAPEGLDALALSFALPRGSYALCVLREVMKTAPLAEAAAEPGAGPDGDVE